MKECDGMKRCPKCGETKPVTAFYANLGANDGLQTYCKPCMNEYTTTYQKARRARNRARHLAQKAGGEE
jgi:hypothetical protein